MENWQNLKWFHQIRLPDGTITPGVDDSAAKLQRISLPASLAGRTVLDVGAWDGFFSFECERRGAERVVAVDHFSWGGGGWGDFRAFSHAHRALGSRVEPRDIDIPAVTCENLGEFDVILCLGVLYHLPDPFSLLLQLRPMCRGLLVIETVYALNFVPLPVARFLRERELNLDPTNHWLPNVACLKAMLERAGFSKVRVVNKKSRKSLSRFGSGRVVIHAEV